MTAPHLAHPEWAPFVAASLIGVAVATTLSWLLARRRARRLLGDARAMPPARLGADLLLVAAIAAIGLAWLGLKLGTRVVRVPGSGVDLVVLFDTSRSMDATDVPPSRIARARELTREVLARLGGEDRAALAVFASRGVVLSPLTPDTDALAELAAALDTELVRPSGSDLGAGVAAAVTAFEAGSTRPRVLLVLSDGEDPEARADAGSAVARRADTRVVAVAFGGEAGASIPAGDVTLADERGRPVQTRRDVARLAELADATGGIAFAADRWGEVDLAGLLAELRRDGAQASGGLVERRVPATQVVPLALFAFVLLALEWIGGPRALCAALRRRRALALGAAGALALATAAIAAQDDAVAWLEARLRERPGDARLLVALGVARAERGDLDEASHALRAAAVGARDPRDAALAYYDLGVLELERRRFDAARDAFLDALALAPDDAEARFNLEWSLRALAAQPESDAQRADDDAREEAERPDPELPDPNAAPGAREGDAKDEPPPPEGEQPRPVANPEAARRFAPELAPDRVQQWLDAVHDDPGRGLRDAARDAADARTRRAERPRW